MPDFDAMKFRVLIRGPVDPDCRLFPSIEDLRHVKRFLSEVATATNQRVGNRLAQLCAQSDHMGGWG